MNRTWTVILAIVIALHGLVHLMGTFAYLKLAEVQGLPYKTTMFGGQWIWARLESRSSVSYGPWQPWVSSQAQLD
jgi:hypothetical protein